eukprot:TRINITY_DN210_c0_g1_i7.p1 TRINITY_DN210_c0_g1~~TRINITY_DN210_c0_g1_i7.p1  ORF type:complete len:767 (+),score=84.54 TRINITY_DN210_c0_g1_i7:2252-4552(+)
METRSSKGVSSICSYCRESVPSGLLSHHVRLECPVAVSKKGIYCAICDQKYVNYARHLDLPRHRCRLAAVNLSKASAEITPGQQSSGADEFASSDDDAPSAPEARPEQSISAENMIHRRVVRGPDWKWGDQDQDSVGIVERVCSKSSAGGAWLSVRWLKPNRNGIFQVGNYRWGIDGAFDLTIASSDVLRNDRGDACNDDDGDDDDDEDEFPFVESGTPFAAADDGTHRHGRPPETSRYVSAESALLQGIFERHRLTDAAVSDILSVLHTPGFDLNRLAPSAFQLRKVQTMLLPKVATQTADLCSLGRQIYFHKPLDVIANILQQPGAIDGFRWHYEPNGGVIENATNTSNWREYEADFRELLDAGHRLLLVRVNHDAYDQQTKRKRKLTALYISLANDPEGRRWLLCLVPDTKDLKDDQYRDVLHELAEVVLLPDMQLLEDGKVQLDIGKGEKIRLCGSIFCIIGLDQARIRWKTEFYAAYSGLPGCSFTYPNLDTEDAWPEQIRFLGPPSDQCTSLYEHEHTPTKCIGTRHSNQREIEKTILGKRDREVFCAIDGSVVLHGADDVQPVKKPRPPALASGFRAIGKPQTVALSDAILDIIRPVLLRIGCGPCAGVQRFEGWTLGAVRARTGAFLKYESRAGDAAKQYALLLGVYRCRLKGIAKSVVLAYVQKFEHVGEQRPCVRARHSFPILQPAHSELIALGFPFFKINKLISVVRHPLRPGMYLYNNRIRNELVVSDSGTTDLVAAVADSGSDDDVDDSDVDG